MRAQICENGEVVFENSREINWKKRNGKLAEGREIAKSDGGILCATHSEDCLWFSHTPESSQFSIQSQLGVFYRNRAQEQRLLIQGRITEIAAVDYNVCYFVVYSPDTEGFSGQLLRCQINRQSGFLESRYIDHVLVRRRISITTKSLVGGMGLLLSIGKRANLISTAEEGKQSLVRPVRGWTSDSSYTDWFATFLEEQKAFAVVRTKKSTSSSVVASRPNYEFMIDLINPVSEAVSKSLGITTSVSTDLVSPVQISSLPDGRLILVMSDGTLLEIQEGSSSLASLEPPPGSLLANESVLQAALLSNTDEFHAVYLIKKVGTGRTRTIVIDLNSFSRRPNSIAYHVDQSE